MYIKTHKLKYSANLLPAGLLCVLFAIPALTSAQTDTTKKLKEVRISENVLPQIHIIPSQAISANDFDRYSAFNVADAIRNFTGVNIKDYGGIGGLKTVSVRSLGTEHLAVLYDDVQITDNETGQIDLGKLNLFNVASIELYNAQPPEICMPARSFASASVLSIKTVRPNLSADKPYAVLLGVKGGAFGLVNPYVQWQQRINNNWSFIINSYWEKANGSYQYRVHGDGSDTSSTRTNADVNRQEVDGALYWAKTDSNKFNLHLNYYNSDDGLPGAVIFYNPVSNQRLWNKDFFLQSGYEHVWTNSLHLLVNTKLSQNYIRYTDPDFLNNSGGLDDRYTQREFYLSAAIAYHIYKGWEVSYISDVSLSDDNANLPNYVYPSRFTLLSVFASNYTVGKLRLQGNILNTNIDEQVKNGASPSARNIFSPTIMATFLPLAKPDLQVRAFYKDIFRNPTFEEQYYFSTNGSRGIKPEYAKQLDFGFTYVKALTASFFDYISFAVDGYHNNVTNKIVAIPNQNPVITSIVNLGKVDINGIDFSFKTQTKLMEGWRGVLSLNYTYQQALNVTNPADSYYNQQIPYTPQNTGALNVGVTYKNAGLYYNQVVSSLRYFLNNNDAQNLVDGYSVSDLSFVYKFTAGKLPALFTVYANNLFNEDYSIIRSFPMPGRSIILSFQIKI